MKKLLFLAVLLLAACQKDYYLEDLQQAEFEIQQLQSISDAKTDEINNLQEIINTINADLNAAQEHIVAITSDLAEVNKERDLLQIDVDRLVGIVVNKEEEIDSLLAQAEVDSLAISNLNDEVASLETALANVEAIAAERLTKITELENQPPTIVTVTQTRTQVVYQDREVVRYVAAETPATPETGVSYNADGNVASNLDTTDCVGAVNAILNNAQTLVTFAAVQSNSGTCSGTLGVEVLRGNTIIASNDSHFVATTSTASVTSGEIVTVRATGASSFTATVTIPDFTLPEAEEAEAAVVTPTYTHSHTSSVNSSTFSITFTPDTEYTLSAGRSYQILLYEAGVTNSSLDFSTSASTPVQTNNASITSVDFVVYTQEGNDQSSRVEIYREDNVTVNWPVVETPAAETPAAETQPPTYNHSFTYLVNETDGEASVEYTGDYDGAYQLHLYNNGSISIYGSFSTVAQSASALSSGTIYVEIYSEVGNSADQLLGTSDTWTYDWAPATPSLSATPTFSLDDVDIAGVASLGTKITVGTVASSEYTRWTLRYNNASDVSSFHGPGNGPDTSILTDNVSVADASIPENGTTATVIFYKTVSGTEHTLGTYTFTLERN